MMTFIFINATAQTTFQKTFGGTIDDYGTAAQQTSDGGYAMVGHTNNFGTGSSDKLYLIRTNANGDTLWTKTYGGAGDLLAYTLQQTSNDGFILTGYTNASGAGNLDLLLIKTDESGNPTWTKTFGGPGLDVGHAVRQTTDGGFIVAGVTDLGAGNGDLYLIRVNSSGDSIFTKTIGGTGIDRASSIQVTADGGFIIGGYTSSSGAGENDFYLIKTSSDGMVTWVKTLGGASADNGNDVQQTTDGGYIFVGNTMSFGAGGSDVYLIKTDASGTPVWSKTYGGSGGEFGNSVQQTGDGGYVVAGYSSSFPGVYLIRTDGNGNLNWSKNIGGLTFDWGSTIGKCIDGGFVIAGYTLSFGVGSMDAYLIKTDAGGNTGCNDGNPLTESGSVVTLTGSPSLTISMGSLMDDALLIAYGGGTSTTICLTTPVEETTPGNPVSVSPNPFVRLLSIHGTKGSGRAFITDMSGKIILKQNTVAGETILNLENIAPGSYLLNCSEGITERSFKVVKY
jgi:hypothetical protein